MLRRLQPGRIARRSRAPLAALVAGWAAVTSAGAETRLTELNGPWRGSGTDRDLPFATLQPTQCRTRVTADATHLASETQCSGKAGLDKHIRLSTTFAGNSLSGTVEQTSTLRGSSAPPTRRAGTLAGTRSGDTLEFEVRFGGLTPNAHVVLQLTSPSTFSMRISTLGAALTDVVSQRPGRR